MNDTNENEFCDKHCIKDCNQEYYSLDFDNKYIIHKTNSTIRINYQNYAEYQYKAEPKNTFELYLSDIGGLIGLWFGLSFIDLNIILKSLFNKIQSKLEFLISLEYLNSIPFIIFLKRKIMKYLIILNKFKKFNWKSFLKVISIPIICFQIYDLCENYLQFSTELNFEHNIYRDRNKTINIEKFPQISICSENIIEELFFNIENEFPKLLILYFKFKYNEILERIPSDLFDFKSNNIRNHQILKIYYHYHFFSLRKGEHDHYNFPIFLKMSLDLNNRKEFIEESNKRRNFSYYGLERMKSELDFYSIFHKIFMNEGNI